MSKYSHYLIFSESTSFSQSASDNTRSLPSFTSLLLISSISRTLPCPHVPFSTSLAQYFQHLDNTCTNPTSFTSAAITPPLNTPLPTFFLHPSIIEAEIFARPLPLPFSLPRLYQILFLAIFYCDVLFSMILLI